MGAQEGGLSGEEAVCGATACTPSDGDEVTEAAERQKDDSARAADPDVKVSLEKYGPNATSPICLHLFTLALIILYTMLVFDEHFGLGPDISTPFSPGLSFACVAEPWSRVAHCAATNTSPFVASQPLSTPGACDDFMEKSNVLPSITSLSLLAVNFLPCVSTLQANTVGKEYPFIPF
ncbi:hypothetical protein GOODEAATRI_007073 [Goodea atripinnis]|uniref:Uncharacterized protein n=1 Tax=Goodea atripinnis TaxID=208336 RepID=A0ABV0PW09_9TELE